jgi:UDP-3-O-[3-hydroxymyristoyl] glucosamine N-acyltransferase
MINDTSRPLILIGSNSALFFLQDLCDELGINIAGIIDSDYYSNTAQLSGIPVIDTEQVFDNAEQLAHYKANYNFFLATNWFPLGIGRDRESEKRKRLMQVIDQFDLPCISLVSPDARIQKTTQIGKCVLVDAFVYISANNIIDDYVTFQTGSGIGYHNHVQRNVVFQRWAGMMHKSTVGEDAYIGLNVQIFGDGLTIGRGTIIHPCIAIRRDTSENEIVSLVGKDLRKTYMFYTEEDIDQRLQFVQEKHDNFANLFKNT